MKMNLSGVPVARKSKGKGKASKKARKKVAGTACLPADGGVR